MQWNSIFLSARKAEGPVEEVAALPTLADAEKVSSFKASGSGGRDAILGVGCSLKNMKNMLKRWDFMRIFHGIMGFHQRKWEMNPQVMPCSKGKLVMNQ